MLEGWKCKLGGIGKSERNLSRVPSPVIEPCGTHPASVSSPVSAPLHQHARCCRENHLVPQHHEYRDKTPRVGEREVKKEADENMRRL